MIISVIISLILFESSVECSQWTKLVDKTHEWSNEYSQRFNDRFILISKSKNISNACKESIFQTVTGIKTLELWAIDMINSWGSFPPTGVRIGTSTDFGSYDQCLAIEPNAVIEKSQYCLIDVIPPLPMPMPVHHNLHHRIDVLPKDFENKFNISSENVFKTYSEFASFFYWISLRTGVCTPSKCTQCDISLLAKGFADGFGLELQRVRCETKPTETALSSIQMIAIIFLACILVISLTATLLDKFWAKKKIFSKNISLLINLFSFTQNLNCLLAKRSSEALPCVHGIRVISMVWVIFGHTTEWMNYQSFNKVFRAKQEFAGIENQILLNAFYAIETFFFIGGMLTSYITFQHTRGDFSNFKTMGFLISRALRLTPQIIIFMLLTFLLPLGGWASGPLWNETVNPIIENCSTKWWWNVIYLQNWFERSRICAVHTWYLACDMQFHWLSLLIVVPLLYSSKIGIFINFVAGLLTYFSTLSIAYYLDLPPGTLNTGRDQHFWSNYIEIFYHRPYAHSTSFIIGLFLGYLAYYKRFIKLSKIMKTLIFAMIILGYMVCLMDTYYWNEGNPFNRLISALVYSTCRVIWPLSMAGLVWMCISGNGGIINKFLSARIFTLFSRLTYSVFLTHAWIIWIFIGTRRERVDLSKGELFYIFLHNLILAYSLGFIFSILFETPVLRLQTRLNKRIYNSNENTDNEPQIRVKLTKINNNNIDA